MALAPLRSLQEGAAFQSLRAMRQCSELCDVTLITRNLVTANGVSCDNAPSVSVCRSATMTGACAGASDCATETEFRINCHRLVLGASSEYFRTLFTKANAPCPCELVFTEVDPSVLHLFVDFVYAEECAISYENMSSIVTFADAFQVETLKIWCVQQARCCLNPIDSMNVALQIADDELFDEAARALNLCASSQDNIDKLQLTALEKLLAREDLNVQNEDELMNLVAVWFVADASRQQPDTVRCVMERIQVLNVSVDCWLRVVMDPEFAFLREDSGNETLRDALKVFFIHLHNISVNESQTSHNGRRLSWNTIVQKFKGLNLRGSDSIQNRVELLRYFLAGLLVTKPTQNADYQIPSAWLCQEPRFAPVTKRRHSVIDRLSNGKRKSKQSSSSSLPHNHKPSSTSCSAAQNSRFEACLKPSLSVSCAASSSPQTARVVHVVG